MLFFLSFFLDNDKYGQKKLRRTKGLRVTVAAKR